MVGARSFLFKLNMLSCYLVGLLSVLLLSGCTNAPNKPINAEVLMECGWLPNCVNTQSDRDGQGSKPIAANTEQWKKLKSWINKQQDWEVTMNEDRFLQAVVRTPLMKFRDDVQLLFLPDAQLIHVRSSSRLGISDMGVNAKRVETLRKQVAAQSKQ
jgi:uncharacterized protein (DUF1499 family)